MEDLADEIRAAFGIDGVPSGDFLKFVTQYPDPLWDVECDDKKAHMAKYMCWCLLHPDWSELVMGYTFRALAEFGRSKNPSIEHLNFAFRCDQRQREAVLAFLKWGQEKIPLASDREMISRAVVHWQQRLER